MRIVKAKQLSKDEFEKYGSYTDVTSPHGYGLGGFYPDRVGFPVSGEMPLGISALKSERIEPMRVTKAEYHNKTSEGICCLNDDVVIHVAPASDVPVPELTEAFYVPKGTFVRLNPGVWHMAALPVHEAEAQVMILLPERTYVNDCIVVEYKEEDWIEIQL